MPTNTAKYTTWKKFEKISKKGLTFDAKGIIIAYVRSRETTNANVKISQEQELFLVDFEQKDLEN